MTKILITGGAGYIGSHTIIELLENTDFNIISADNYINSDKTTYDRIEEITGKRIKYYEVDLCDTLKTEQIFIDNSDIAGIIHFAALKSVPESVANPNLYYHNNNESLKNILNCISKYKVKNFIFSSSCSVYGNISSLPVNETTPLSKAESPYAHTKQQGEEMIKEFAAANPEINCISLRYFNPVGAHLSGLNGELPRNIITSLVPIVTRVAIGKMKELVVYGNTYPTRDGTCIRDYVHVSDIAAAHVLALNHCMSKKMLKNYDVLNLGTGEGVTVLEAIKAFEKVTGKPLNYRIGDKRAGDVGAIYSDPTKTAAVLRWKPKYTIEEMMESAWKWELNCKAVHQ